MYGEPTDLVEIPVSWQLDDFPAFEFVWGLNSGLRSPSDVLEIWKGDFDYASRRPPRRLQSMPSFPSHCSRTSAVGLEQLFEYITDIEEVKFETVTSYAERWKGGNPRG